MQSSPEFWEVGIIFPFYRWENWGPEKLDDLPTVTQWQSRNWHLERLQRLPLIPPWLCHLCPGKGNRSLRVLWGECEACWYWDWYGGPGILGWVPGLRDSEKNLSLKRQTIWQGIPRWRDNMLEIQPCPQLPSGGVYGGVWADLSPSHPRLRRIAQ